jgi:hypothetical protein
MDWNNLKYSDQNRNSSDLPPPLSWYYFQSKVIRNFNYNQLLHTASDNNVSTLIGLLWCTVFYTEESKHSVLVGPVPQFDDLEARLEHSQSCAAVTS